MRVSILETNEEAWDETNPFILGYGVLLSFCVCLAADHLIEDIIVQETETKSDRIDKLFVAPEKWNELPAIQHTPVHI
jgi:hypothetical protein